MTFDLGMWPLTLWNFPCYIHGLILIRLQLFKWDQFYILAYLTTWPQMTFDHGMWPLTSWTYEGSHIISINQVWFKSDFIFSIDGIFTFLAYLTTWPQMNFDLHMWPLTLSTNEGSHVASMTQLCWNPSKHEELEPNVNLVHDATDAGQTTTVDKVIPICLSC